MWKDDVLKMSDYYYYLNGRFYDRMSNKPAQVAKILNAKIVKRDKKAPFGDTRVYLKSNKVTNKR